MQGWMNVWICYCHALEKGCLSKKTCSFCSILLSCTTPARREHMCLYTAEKVKSDPAPKCPSTFGRNEFASAPPTFQLYVERIVGIIRIKNPYQIVTVELLWLIKLWKKLSGYLSGFATFLDHCYLIYKKGGHLKIGCHFFHLKFGTA